MRIGIIGKGNVGRAMATGLSRVGNEIKYGHRDPKEPVGEAAKWSEVTFLAVPYESVTEVAAVIGSLADGKTVVDVTNAVGENCCLTIGFSTSASEQLQKKLPKARIVKAFNTVFVQNQSTGTLGGEQLTLFVASDDANAKRTAMALGEQIGFEPVDAGLLRNACYLEPMGMFMINLGYVLGMGPKIGFKLIKGYIAIVGKI